MSSARASRSSYRAVSAIILCFSALTPCVAARADFVAKLDTKINGTAANRNDITQPYVTATFHTVSTGTVTITVSASNLINNGTTTEFIRSFLFNVTPTINPDTLTFAETSGPTTVIHTAGSTGETGGNNVKGGRFDVLFSYAVNALTSGAGNTPAVYTVTAAGITAESFEFFSSNPSPGFGGPYLAAVDIAGIPGSASGSIGSLTATPVPEPTSLALVGLGLGLALAVIRRSRRPTQP
jgi:hypothetical protein